MTLRGAALFAGALLLLAVATFEGTGLRTRFFGRKRFRFVYATLSSKAEAGLPNPGGPFVAERTTLRSGVMLNLLISRREGSGAPWLVYFPGNDPRQLGTGERVLQNIGRTLPANLCVLSYRGFSGSSGTPEVGAIAEDVVEVVQGLMEREKGAGLHLIGFSIGGYFAAHAAQALATRGVVPRTLVLFAPGYDLVMVRPSRFERLAPGDDYQLSRILPGVRSETLVLQGTLDDAFGGPEQGRAVARELGLPAQHIPGQGPPGNGSAVQYEEYEGVRHEEIHEHTAALERARDFIAQRL